MSIELNIANANGYFTDDELRILRSATSSVWGFLDSHFKMDYGVNLVVAKPMHFFPVIPEDGINARTYEYDFMMLCVDKLPHDILFDRVFEIVCHEMSHSIRWKKIPEFADTLFENAIMEGLAVVLEEVGIREMGRKSQQFFLSAMQKAPKETIYSVIREFGDSLHSSRYNYERDFFTGSDTLPRWSGYMLGYHLVKEYLDKTGDSIFDATLASYSNFKKVLEI